MSKNPSIFKNQPWYFPLAFHKLKLFPFDNLLNLLYLDSIKNRLLTFNQPQRTHPIVPFHWNPCPESHGINPNFQ